MNKDTHFDLSSDLEVRIRKFFLAPPELLYKVLSDPAQVPHWWGPRRLDTKVERFDFKVGGQWRVLQSERDGRVHAFHGEFKEIQAPKRIVRTFEYEGAAGHVLNESLEIQGQDGGSLLIISSQFQSKAERDAMLQSGMESGVREGMERLEEVLAKERAGKAFVSSRKFRAPRDLVFKVWTQKEHLMKWFGPTGLEFSKAELDLRPGGIFHYAMKTPDGHEMWGKWVFREILPPERIVLISSFSDAQAGFSRHPMSPKWPLETLSTTTLVEEKGETTLTISWLPFNASEEEIAVFQGAFQSMDGGWAGTFAQLEKYLAAIQ